MNHFSKLLSTVCLTVLLIATGLRAGDIHDAAATGDLNKVRALLEADPTLLESKDVRLQYSGNTPLISACWGLPANISQEKVAKFLIDQGANINAQNTSGGSPLYFAHRSFDLMQRLIAKGADVNVRAYGGLTPLHQTASTGNLKVAKLLIDHGADLNVRSQEGTILQTIINRQREPKVEMAKLLIEGGAKLQEYSFGNTELHLAAMKGLADLVPILVKHGADVNAVKTKNHLLIFNPSKIDESPEAGLANGYLNPNELAGQKITVLINHRLGPYGPSVSDLAKAMPGADFVLNFKPTAGNAGNNDIPPYRLAAPNESFSIDGIRVHTIPAMLKVFFEGEGLGYLVEADGVKIFHAGLHVSDNNASNVAKFRKEIDFLKPFGPIDIAILPINGRHIYVAAYEPYLYLLDQLSPKAVYLIGDDLPTEEHLKCVEILQARNIPVKYPEGGIAMGERFHYLRD